MPCNVDMPCDYDSGARNEINKLQKRVAYLEQAMCGLCQMIEDSLPRSKGMHPQLQDWFDNHKQQEGCELKGR